MAKPIPKRHKAACIRAAKLAIDYLGGISAAHRITGIPKSTIGEWSSSGVSERHLAVMVAATGLPASRLRPDIEEARLAAERVAASRKQETEKCNAQHTAAAADNESEPASASAASQ